MFIYRRLIYAAQEHASGRQGPGDAAGDVTLGGGGEHGGGQRGGWLCRTSRGAFTGHCSLENSLTQHLGEARGCYRYISHFALSNTEGYRSPGATGRGVSAKPIQHE
jgi:hypothetical protein